MLHAALNKCHTTTALCVRGIVQKIRKMSEEEARAGAAMAFREYGKTLETVTSFEYLRRLITATHYDWTAVIVNLQKALKIWACLYRILGREGSDPRTSGCFYLYVVQEVLLFGTEIWVVVNPRIGRPSGSFHHRVVIKIAEKQPRRQAYGSCPPPPLEYSMQEVVLEDMDTYISRYQNTVAQ